jgi:hypothetical protein
VPTQLHGVLLHTMAISGLPRVRTELNPLLIIPCLAHHPVQRNGQSPSHGHLGDLSSSSSSSESIGCNLFAPPGYVLRTP